MSLPELSELHPLLPAAAATPLPPTDSSKDADLPAAADERNPPQQPVADGAVQEVGERPRATTPSSSAAHLTPSGEVVPTAYTAPAEPMPGPAEQVAPQPPQLAVPPELPGAEAGPLVVPPFGEGNEAERNAALEKIYNPIPPIEGSPPNPPPQGGPLDLARLQEIAMSNSPVLRVAAAEVESTRGLAIQAGAYPNPELGYEADTVNTARTAGYHGAYVNQTFVTGGKLRLAQSAAEVDFVNAQVALRRARIDVATAVRTAYFEALVAREQLRIQSTLAKFTESVFRTQIKLVEAGEAAAYEPLQLRVMVAQSRAAVVQAQQRYAAARRRLTAALGLPQMPLGELIGRPDMPIPAINYDAALAVMLANHTDLTTARNKVVQTQRLLQLARVTPRPNIDTYLAVQHDYTFNPGTTTVNVQVGGPIPVFNRNRGNIISAQAKLTQAQQAIGQVENDLTGQLADAYSRYESNRRLAQDFQPASLRDQVRTYRGIYERYRSDARGMSFNDVIVAQQTLSVLLVQYLNLLGDQWQAVVDVAELLQVDDIYLLGETLPVEPLPELDGPQDAVVQPPSVGTP
jgi:cobalt-zinc-cadmium efflux system outer membrane protein